MYPRKNPEGLAFSCVLYPIYPYTPTTDSPPIYPKLTNMFVLSGQFADVGRTLGLHCRCLRMFPGRVTLFTDVPSLFADVLTKPADLAIGDHRAPQSGQCKPGFRLMHTILVLIDRATQEVQMKKYLKEIVGSVFLDIRH